MENHSFSVEMAILLTQEGATLLQHHYFWHKRNKANNKNFIDGYYWTYNSASAFSEVFPYLSEKQIRSLHENFIACGFMVKGNYNKNKCDRSQWFALTDFGISIFENWNLPKVYSMLQKVKWICQNVKSKSKKVKSIYLEVTPIPDVKPNVNTDVISDKEVSVVTDTPPLATNLSSTEIPNNCQKEKTENLENVKTETLQKKVNSGGGGENSQSNVGNSNKPKKQPVQRLNLSSLTTDQIEQINAVLRRYDDENAAKLAWLEWLEHKSKAGGKIKQYKDHITALKALELASKQAQFQSEALTDAVNNSIANEYQGIFPENFVKKSKQYGTIDRKQTATDRNNEFMRNIKDHLPS